VPNAGDDEGIESEEAAVGRFLKMEAALGFSGRLMRDIAAREYRRGSTYCCQQCQSKEAIERRVRAR
jgi:hypothetical protein